MIYELKRYLVRPDCHDIFFDVWRRIVLLRKKHGFVVLFVLFNRESGWFTWSVGHEDFDSAAKQYYADPDRVVLDVIVDYVMDFEITRVERIPIP